MSEEQATYQCSLSAQELRIGNWVYDGERTQFPMQVVAIGKDWVQLDFPGNEGGVWESDIKDLRGIRITQELLEECGYKYSNECYGYKRLDEWKMMQFYKHESRLRVYYRGKHEELPGEVIYECHGIHYLHELQNAYYMATGEELEVQP